MAGRKPKPDALKEAQGNPGRRKLVTKENPAAKAADENLPAVGGVPSQLSRDGKKIWQELVPTLSQIRFVRSTDRQMLARYCENLAEWWAATKRLRKEGTTYWTKSNHGDLKRINPDFTVQDRLDRRLIALEDRIGLSPQARQNLLLKLANALPPAPDGMFSNGKDGDQAETETPEAGGTAVGVLASGHKLH